MNDNERDTKILELLQAILDKLEEIRCCVIDVENATEQAASRIVREA